MKYKLSPLVLGVIAAMSSPLAYSEQALQSLEKTTITSILSDADKLDALDGQRVSASEGAILIGGDYVKAQQASTIADMLRKTSIQVDEEGGQQGARVYVRGFTGDQVSIRVEGAPKNFNQVRHGGANAIWLEPDMYKSVSVVPGVAANVYGNGSLGGVVLFETKDPEDIIKQGRDWGVNLRGGFETNAQSKYVSIDAATKITDNLAISGTLVTRNTEQYKDGNGKKALLGATGTDDTNLLLKTTYAIDEDQNIEASYTGLRKEYTARTTTGSGAYTDPSYTEVDDDTYSIQYTFNPSNNNWLDLNARFSQANTQRYRLTEGSTSPDIWGVETSYFELENRSTVTQSENIRHSLRYGFDYTYDDVLSAYSSSTTGNSLVRERTQSGVYMSDTIQFSDNLQVVASIRFDSFKNESDLGQSIDETGSSPKLSFNWNPFEQTSVQGLSFFGVIGKGFRTPSTHESFGTSDGLPICGRSSCSETKPNESLKGETSDSWEAGIRFNRGGLFSKNDNFSFQLGYINNDVDDYIASIIIDEYTADIDNDGNDDLVEIKQYVNLNKAEINGFELSLNYTNDHWFTAITGQNLDGKDDSGIKLADISPASLNVTIGAYLFDDKSRVGIDMTSRKKREYVQRRTDRVRAAYSIFDVFASYQFNNALLLQLRIENALDKQYSKRAIAEIDGEDVTTYSPGRNVKFTMQYSF